METTHSTYLDFDLEISRGSGREYPVAVRSPAGEAREKMHFPFDESELENRLLTLQNARQLSAGPFRKALSYEEEEVQRFGKDLFSALLVGELCNLYRVSQHMAEERSKGLRLKLRIQPPELAGVPWEFMYDPRGEYVCFSRGASVVRYLEMPHAIQPLTVALPLRILGMIANPHDLAPMDVMEEKHWVDEAIQRVQKRGVAEMTWIEGQTWRDLERAMQGGPWHVFHFIGHGGFDRQADEGFIALADEHGSTYHLSASGLARLLDDQRSLRLVLLNACEGARGGKRDILSSTASILMQRGIMAVVAMQREITDLAAVEFARAFYVALAEALPVDAAVSKARKAISMEVGNSVEWGTPVLYMRSPDGVLFIPQNPEEAPAPEPEPSTGDPVASPETKGNASKNIETSNIETLGKAGQEERDRLDDGHEAESPPPLPPPRFHFDSSTFKKINQRSFFEKGEWCEAGGMVVVPVWPDSAKQIKVSSAGHDKRNASVTVSKAGQITVKSWDRNVTPIKTKVSYSWNNWPHVSHSWKFACLNLMQGFQLEDNEGLFDSNIIAAAWWIWHKATGRNEEEFLILVGKTRND
jgi:hypothetical protein